MSQDSDSQHTQATPHPVRDARSATEMSVKELKALQPIPGGVNVSIEPAGKQPTDQRPVLEETKPVILPAGKPPKALPPVTDPRAAIEPVVEQPNARSSVAEPKMAIEPAGKPPKALPPVTDPRVAIEPVVDEPKALKPVLEDPRPAIELVGKELTALLAELADGERNPQTRLDLKPVLSRALKVTEEMPQLRQAREGRLLSEAQRQEALSALRPQLTISSGVGQRDVNQGSVAYSGIGKQTTITGRQLIYDFGAASGGLKAAEKRMSASDLRVELSRSEICLRALDAFYETQRALLQVRLSRENLQARRSFVTYIRKRTELGASSKADVVRAEARVAEGLDQLATAMQRLSNVQATFRQFYGEEAVAYVLPAEPTLDDIDLQSLPEMLREHPQLREAELLIEASTRERDAARARLLGSVYFEVTRSETADPSRPISTSNSAMLMLRSDIYDGGGQQARVAQSDAKLAQARSDMERIRLDLERQLREAYADHQGQIAAVSARLLVFRASEDTYAIAKDLYAFSRSSLFEVFKAQEELYVVGQRLIDSMIDRAKSKFKLLHASNRLVKFATEY